ncbi:hypothetical protein SAMN05421773_114168 [Streptomyces aidingensis]|uniref:Uncharacterized protein n=1 Tax=Streptomyces aidingensis TaxID=910347 RepID=A0A1I1S3L3_9ACTN|nr:hypothetical protein SAMN05421773_114168 [Streptomyces aidingensis]
MLTEEYAIKIARDWNVKHDGAGYVTRFEVGSDFLSRYPVQQAGGRTILELWVPAEEPDEFNAHITGEIQVTHGFRRPACGGAVPRRSEPGCAGADSGTRNQTVLPPGVQL